MIAGCVMLESEWVREREWMNKIERERFMNVDDDLTVWRDVLLKICMCEWKFIPMKWEMKDVVKKEGNDEW